MGANEVNKRREPIARISAVVTTIQAMVPLLMAFGIASITKEQAAAISAAVVAWGGLLGTFFGRNLVTPVADPRDDQGRKLEANDSS